MICWPTQGLPGASEGSSQRSWQLEDCSEGCCHLCAAIDEVRTRGDSCGGEVTCVIRACPKGLGSPVFDKLEAELAKAFMSLPASKVRMHRPPPASYHGECCLK